MARWHNKSLTVSLTKTEFEEMERFILASRAVDRKFFSQFRQGEAQVREYFTSAGDKPVFYRMSRITEQEPDERASCYFDVVSPNQETTDVAYSVLRDALVIAINAREQIACIS